jgi:hypothetical protein
VKEEQDCNGQERPCRPRRPSLPAWRVFAPLPNADVPVGVPTPRTWTRGRRERRHEWSRRSRSAYSDRTPEELRSRPCLERYGCESIWRRPIQQQRRFEGNPQPRGLPLLAGLFLAVGGDGGDTEFTIMLCRVLSFGCITWAQTSAVRATGRNGTQAGQEANKENEIVKPHSVEEKAKTKNE